MPSPFPGMDPYLEGSEWTSVHAELAGEIARQLVPKVAPNYTVRPVRRFIMDMFDEITIVSRKQDTYPDIGLYKTKEATVPYGSALPPEPIIMDTVLPEKIPVTSVEIRDVANRDLITVIELISPTNKRGEGYQEYVQKRLKILNSSTHLLEIDLLRRGKRVPMRQVLPQAAYFIFLSRVGSRPATEVWPIQLHMRLPEIPIPLLPDDEDVTLDLQTALNTAHDTFRYDLSLNYTQPPEILLEGETAVWATTLLQKAGFTGEQESK